MIQDPPQQVQAAKFEKDAQLQLFGIDSTSQPTPTRYPKTFNAQGLRIWNEVLESAAYQQFKKCSPKASQMWEYCIKAFLKQCAANEIYPFTGRADFEELTTSFLTSARSTLVKWFHESGIFNVVKIRSVTRAYTFTHQNFSLEVTAELRPISDPTFEAWLTKNPVPGFKKQEGIYKKSLKAHIDVEHFVKRGTPYLTYRVFCHTPVRALDPNLLGKAKLSKYVETKLWDPLIKAQPIEGLGNRRY